MRARVDKVDTGRVSALHAVTAQVVADAVVGGSRMVLEAPCPVLGRAERGALPMDRFTGKRDHRAQAAGETRGALSAMKAAG